MQTTGARGEGWPVTMYMLGGSVGSARRVDEGERSGELVLEGLDSFAQLFFVETLAPFGPDGGTGTPLGEIWIEDRDHQRWIHARGARVRGFSSGPSAFVKVAAEELSVGERPAWEL